MKESFEGIINKIRTKEELVFFLGEIAGKKLALEEKELYDLEKELRSLPEIKLEIAFNPSDYFINRLSGWLKREFGRKTILDITVNPKIVAGAIIEYQGNWRDFSAAKKIDQLLTGN